ncbi:hypothetical protein [Dongshaea marina]|uniref:hypothetical protein n=1 Tax=Dongshaea marina TaxID=2047966 RepID=UPI00131F2598|nr:hypothetical protein [Dongshaea marina]
MLQIWFCRWIFFQPARQKMRGVVALHEHLITQPGGKIATALRVAPEKALSIVARHSFRTTQPDGSRREQNIFRSNRFNKIGSANRTSPQILRLDSLVRSLNNDWRSIPALSSSQ